MVTSGRFRTYAAAFALALAIISTAPAKYSGGTGEPNDPYQIATAADLIALGEEPNDCDKHFLLTADIDLDPNLPGRKVFDRAVIAPDTNDAPSSWFEGTAFTGVFDGNGHTISHLTITGGSYLGLFGQLVGWGSGAEVKDLGMADVNITGTGRCVGGLVGYCDVGTVTGCYSSGSVSGADFVGGLVGSNDGSIVACHSSASVSGEDFAGGLAGANGGLGGGLMARCCSTGSVSGKNYVGGLVGSNNSGSIVMSYSTGSVTGEDTVGGLVGDNSGYGDIVMSYSTSSVTGEDTVGGLVGANVRYPRYGSIRMSYSTGSVTGEDTVGGLVGNFCGFIDSSFWDIETSGQATSAGGTGKTTAEMMDPNTFMAAGWDFVGQPDGPHDIWAQPESGGYPILWWQLPAGFGLPDFSGGTGEANDPYLIATGEELNSIGHNPRLMACHFALANDLDLVGLRFHPIGSTVIWDFPYVGVFDGKGHTISHLTGSNGLFVHLGRGAHVRNVSVVDVSIAHSNDGSITACYSSGSINGLGGLVNFNDGSISACYSTASVSGDNCVGGLVGFNWGSIAACYSSGSVSGIDRVGGLVGENDGSISACYSTGAVSGREHVGGLIGDGWPGGVTVSFWDTQTSGQQSSDGGTGVMTAEMQTAQTFLDVGWDFVGETANGSEDIWKIVEGHTYPLLFWQKYSGGTGEPNDPYQIATASDLIALGETPEDYDKHFILTAEIDLDPNLPRRKVFDKAVIAPDTNDARDGFQGTSFTGVFDGNDHTISHLTIKGTGYVGLFGQLGGSAQVVDLGVSDVNMSSSGGFAGGLVGENDGTVTHCYSTGAVTGTGYCVGGLVGLNCEDYASHVIRCYSTATVSGDTRVGGLVGHNDGTVTQCHSTGTVDGNEYVGGLVGGSYYGYVSWCYSTGAVSGTSDVGGLIGQDYDGVTQCYSTGAVAGNDHVGGLVGSHGKPGYIWDCYSTGAVSGNSDVGGLVGYSFYGFLATACFWDIQTSGQATSAGGTGKTTAEMQTATTFLDAGWDFVGETVNGTEDLWWILEGKDYPRLWWETTEE